MSFRSVYVISFKDEPLYELNEDVCVRGKYTYFQVIFNEISKKNSIHFLLCSVTNNSVVIKNGHSDYRAIQARPFPILRILSRDAAHALMIVVPGRTKNTTVVYLHWPNQPPDTPKSVHLNAIHRP